MSKWAATTAHKFVQLPNQTLHTYNSWDSYWTARLLPTLIRELQDPTRFKGQWRWFQEVVQPLQLAVLDMQARGLQVDRQRKHQWTLETSRELRETDRRIKEDAKGRGFSFTEKFPNSDLQVGRLLFETCGLRAQKKTDKSKRPSVDQDALLRVLRDLRKKDEHARDLLLNLLHRSRLQTMLERYTQFDIDEDGRVRPQVKMAQTKTWRFAYAEPALQQFPLECRGYFTASNGHILVAADFSQLEARWLAILSNDQVSLDDFQAGRDVHARNACDLLGHSESEWEGLEAGLRKASRFFAKTFLYRVSYGGEGATDKSKTFCPCPRCADKVPSTLSLKKKEILAAEERWFQAHLPVRKFHRELIREVQRRGFYESPFGLRRYFGHRWGSDFERELKNAPMQTNSALLMNQRQVKLHRLGAPIVLQHHDSFMLEVPESPGSGVDQWEADLRGVMEEPVPEVGGYSFPVETSRGYSWADL